MPRPQNSSLHRAIGARVRNVRSAAGWTQEALAFAIRVSSKNISSYESGKKALTVPALAAIARALGVPLAQLVDVSVEVPRAQPAPSPLDALVDTLRDAHPEDQVFVLDVARLLVARRANRGGERDST